MSNRQLNGNIELYIDQLVLHDFARADRHRIGEAIRQELLRQLGEHGIPGAIARQHDVSRLIARSVQVEQGGRPERIGAQVGQAIYGSVASERNQGSAPAAPTGATRRSK